nr:hypothetical protein [Tanacetum cinerariifolium]
DPYGENYVIEPSTGRLRRQVPAAIFDDVVASSSSPSSNIPLQAQPSFSKIARASEKRDQLRKSIRQE